MECMECGISNGFSFQLVLVNVVVAVVVSAQNPDDVQILRYENDNGGLGSYNFV